MWESWKVSEISYTAPFKKRVASDEKKCDEKYVSLKMEKLEKKINASRKVGQWRTIQGEVVQISKRVLRFHTLHLVLLIIIDFGFLVGLLHLLKHQHDPSSSLTKLVTSGDIIYTPPIYICNIEKSFTNSEKGRTGFEQVRLVWLAYRVKVAIIMAQFVGVLKCFHPGGALTAKAVCLMKLFFF